MRDAGLPGSAGERPEQRLIDEAAGDRADRAAYCRAGDGCAEQAQAAGKQRAADGRPNGT